ncbi:hypothetical protein BDK51DRAFT_34339, partial [Blyttiomyces helicus]
MVKVALRPKGGIPVALRHPTRFIRTPTTPVRTVQPSRRTWQSSVAPREKVFEPRLPACRAFIAADDYPSALAVLQQIADNPGNERLRPDDIASLERLIARLNLGRDARSDLEEVLENLGLRMDRALKKQNGSEERPIRIREFAPRASQLETMRAEVAQSAEKLKTGAPAANGSLPPFRRRCKAALKAGDRGVAVNELHDLINYGLIGPPEYVHIFAGVDGRMGAAVLGAIPPPPLSPDILHELVRARIDADDFRGAEAWYKLLAPDLIATSTYPDPATYYEIFTVGKDRIVRQTNASPGFLFSCLQDLMAMYQSNAITAGELRIIPHMALEALIHNDDTNGAWFAFTLMRANKLTLTVGQYGRLVRLLCHGSMRARALQVIDDAGPAADSTTYGYLAFHYACHEDPRAFCRTLADIAALTGGSLSSVIISRIAKTSSNPGANSELVQGVVHDMIEYMVETGFVVQETAFNSILKALAVLKEQAAAFRWSQAADRICPRILTGNAAVQMHVYSREFEKALEYIRGIPPGSENEMMPDLKGFTILLGGMLRSGTIDKAQEVYTLMNLHGVSPDIWFMTVSLIGCRTLDEINKVRAE